MAAGNGLLAHDHARLALYDVVKAWLREDEAPRDADADDRAAAAAAPAPGDTTPDADAAAPTLLPNGWHDRRDSNIFLIEERCEC